MNKWVSKFGISVVKLKKNLIYKSKLCISYLMGSGKAMFVEA